MLWAVGLSVGRLSSTTTLQDKQTHTTSSLVSSDLTYVTSSKQVSSEGNQLLTNPHFAFKSQTKEQPCFSKKKNPTLSNLKSEDKVKRKDLLQQYVQTISNPHRIRSKPVKALLLGKKAAGGDDLL